MMRSLGAVSAAENVFLPRRSGPSLVTVSAGERITEPPSILIFGHDRILLRTRGLILSRNGFATRIATKLSEAEQGLTEDPIRLLILCYTLNEFECDRALALSRSYPGLKRLLLAHGNCTDDGVSEVLNVFDGPEMLISAVGKLLHCSTSSNSHDS